MNDIRKGKFYALIFVLFILFLGVGGFFLTKYLTTSANSTPDTPQVIADNDILKLNKEEDYIYFLNEDLKNSEYNINYHDIKININSSDAQNLEKTLNTEMSVLKDTYILIADKDLSNEDLAKVIYTDSGIYEASYNKYTRYISKNYASLLKESYEFNCYEGEKFLKNIAYTFDLTTGKLLTNNEILSAFKLSKDKIKSLVQTRLSEKQTMIPNPQEEELNEENLENNSEDQNLDTSKTNKPENEPEVKNSSLPEMIEKIDIEATLKNLDDFSNCALYIDKSGYLTLSYLVKTHEIDYNDVIILK